VNTNELLIRLSVEPLVSKAIQELKRGTKRGMRNAVDLGVYFAKSGMQKEFFGIAQAVMKKKDNMYYELAKNAFEHIDEKILKTVGVNMGVSSFTFGANVIQEHYKETGIERVWHQAIETDDIPLYQILDQKINNFQKMGVYFFSLGMIKTRMQLNEVISAVKHYKKSTFLLEIQMDDINNEDLNRLSNCQNSFIIVNQEDGKKEHILKELKERQMMFGFSKIYTEESSLDEEEDYIQEMIGQGCIMGMYKNIKRINNRFSADEYNSFYREICTNRKQGKTPILLMDLAEDVEFIKKMMFHQVHLSLAI